MYLTIPEKQPAYRAGRDHGAFITRSQDWDSRGRRWGERIEPALRGLGLRARRAQLADAERAAFAGSVAHHRATAVVDLEAALGMDRDARAPVLVENAPRG